MTKLTDGRRTVSISMQIWDGSGYLPDISSDFFEIGNLPKTEDGETCVVENVDYCIEQAFDWSFYRGDFFDPEVEAYNEEHGYSRNVAVEAV